MPPSLPLTAIFVSGVTTSASEARPRKPEAMRTVLVAASASFTAPSMPPISLSPRSSGDHVFVENE